MFFGGNYPPPARLFLRETTTNSPVVVTGSVRQLPPSFGSKYLPPSRHSLAGSERQNSGGGKRPLETRLLLPCWRETYLPPPHTRLFTTELKQSSYWQLYEIQRNWYLLFYVLFVESK